MAAHSPTDRRISAQIAAHAKWATCDPVAGTAAARAAFDQRFVDEVDPERALDPVERARRAGHARKAYFARLALASAQARRARRTASTEPQDAA